MKPTLSVIAHVDHGKTTFIDTLLEHYKLIINTGLRYLDTRFDEQKRGITLKLSFLGIKEFNIIDTPGHSDLESTIECASYLSDYFIIIVDIVGIEARTLCLLKYIRNRKCILIINKIDKVLDLNDDEILLNVMEIINILNSEIGSEIFKWNRNVVLASSKIGFGINGERAKNVLGRESLKVTVKFLKYLSQLNEDMVKKLRCKYNLKPKVDIFKGLFPLSKAIMDYILNLCEDFRERNLFCNYKNISDENKETDENRTKKDYGRNQNKNEENKDKRNFNENKKINGNQTNKNEENNFVENKKNEAYENNNYNKNFHDHINTYKTIQNYMNTNKMAIGYTTYATEYNNEILFATKIFKKIRKNQKIIIFNKKLEIKIIENIYIPEFNSFKEILSCDYGLVFLKIDIPKYSIFYSEEVINYFYYEPDFCIKSEFLNDNVLCIALNDKINEYEKNRIQENHELNDKINNNDGNRTQENHALNDNKINENGENNALNYNLLILKRIKLSIKPSYITKIASKELKKLKERIKKISLTEPILNAKINKYNEMEIFCEGEVQFEKIIYDLKDLNVKILDFDEIFCEGADYFKSFCFDYTNLNIFIRIGCNSENVNNNINNSLYENNSLCNDNFKYKKTFNDINRNTIKIESDLFKNDIQMAVENFLKKGDYVNGKIMDTFVEIKIKFKDALIGSSKDNKDIVDNNNSIIDSKDIIDNNNIIDNKDIVDNNIIDKDNIINDNDITDIKDVVDDNNSIIDKNNIIDIKDVVDNNSIIDNNDIIDSKDIIDNNNIIDNEYNITDSKDNIVDEYPELYSKIYKNLQKIYLKTNPKIIPYYYKIKIYINKEYIGIVYKILNKFNYILINEKYEVLIIIEFFMLRYFYQEFLKSVRLATKGSCYLDVNDYGFYYFKRIDEYEIRKRKGMVIEKIVDDPEKQRTLKR